MIRTSSIHPPPLARAYSASLGATAYASPFDAQARPVFVRLCLANKVIVGFGAAAPNDDTEAAYVRGDKPAGFTLRAGERIWIKRDANANRAGSAELFADVPGLDRFTGHRRLADDEILPPPRRRAFGATLAASAYASPPTLNFMQATFRLHTRGSTTKGLEVVIERGAAANEASNDFDVRITRINANALAASMDAAAKTVVGNVKNASTMSDLKGTIDAVSGLSSRYFGGETGTGSAEARHVTSAGGAVDRPALAVVTAENPILAVPGADAPGGDGAAAYVKGNTRTHVALRAGERLWLKRIGGTDIRASVELWTGSPAFERY